MKWNEYKSAFTWDGSWRDLYILNTTLTDWQQLIDFLRASSYTLRFDHEEDEPLPEHIAGLFGGEILHLLSINLGGPILNCHFFTEEEIEFDLDPREFKSRQEGERLLAFMKGVGDRLGKAIRLTPENTQNIALVEYDPSRGRFSKPSDWHDVF